MVVVHGLTKESTFVGLDRKKKDSLPPAPSKGSPSPGFQLGECSVALTAAPTHLLGHMPLFSAQKHNYE